MTSKSFSIESHAIRNAFHKLERVELMAYNYISTNALGPHF